MNSGEEAAGHIEEDIVVDIVEGNHIQVEKDIHLVEDTLLVPDILVVDIHLEEGILVAEDTLDILLAPGIQVVDFDLLDFLLPYRAVSLVLLEAEVDDEVSLFRELELKPDNLNTIP